MSKPSDIHIAVQQCLANELGVTKALIEEMVKKRAKKLIEKKIDSMMHEGKLEEIITNRINRRATQGLSSHGFHTIGFDEFIKGCVNSHIKKIIDEKYDIQLIEIKQVREEKG